MITRVHSTAIVVSNQDAALEFFISTLGWVKVVDQMMGETYRFVTVAPAIGGTQIALEAVGVLGDRQPGSPSGISLVADDVDKTYAELSAKGVTFAMVPEDMPWGARGAHFTDPDGNGFFLTSD